MPSTALRAYPAIAEAAGKLRAKTLLLDGEVVMFSEKNVSSFQALQQGRGQPKYAVFDCLYKDGSDLRKKPLSKRRATLEKVMQPSPAILLSAKLATDGRKGFEIAEDSKESLQRIWHPSMSKRDPQSG